jgi:membrane protein YdbS with pleckstrin-like domain
VLADSSGQWRRISPKYLALELVSVAVFGLVTVGGTTLLAFNTSWGERFGWIAPVFFGVVTVIMFVVAPRRVRALGYRLRPDDLLFRRGIMFHRVVAVPYGRMQLIDINRGPIDRMLGLAELRFVTAAASTGVTLPGLPVAEADELRDHLVSLAESRRAGL